MTLSRPLPLLALLPALGLAAASCGRGPSYGSPNAIIAVVDPEIRDRVEPILRENLEREVVTTRPERVFELTFTSPAEIGEFRKWRRLVVIEALDGATLVPELVDAREGGPVVARVEDEWARDQTIYVLAAETPERTVELVSARIDSIYAEIHAAWIAHQVERMWASGPDSALFRSLLDSLGFGVVLPRVYDPAPASAPADSRVWYAEDPRRVVSLHWTPRPAELTPDTVLAIRRAWGRELFPGDEIVGGLGGAPAAASADTTPAAVDTATGPPTAVAPPIQSDRATLDGREAIRLQGVWSATDGVDAGLFLTYGVPCGDRLALLDGNVFAPDRDKYPYLVQLERIFATFRCTEGGA